MILVVRLGQLTDINIPLYPAQKPRPQASAAQSLCNIFYAKSLFCNDGKTERMQH
jgi:hypothetical protein